MGLKRYYMVSTTKKSCLQTRLVPPKDRRSHVKVQLHLFTLQWPTPSHSSFIAHSYFSTSIKPQTLIQLKFKMTPEMPKKNIPEILVKVSKINFQCFNRNFKSNIFLKIHHFFFSSEK